MEYVDYGSERIDFELRFSDRKTLGITVRPDRSVVVTAPSGSDLEAIKRKVRKQAAWIDRQRRFFLSFEPRTPPRRYVPGETHRYLGRRYRLRFEEGEAGLRLQGGFFWARSQVQAGPERRKLTQALFADWYRTKAEYHFPRIAAPYLERFAELGVTPRAFTVRKLDRRWGSCSAGGRVLLNTELIQAPRGCIEYVIVHELCHLLHADHGPRFRALLEREFPRWQRWKGVLEGEMV